MSQHRLHRAAVEEITGSSRREQLFVSASNRDATILAPVASRRDAMAGDDIGKARSVKRFRD